MDTNKIPEGWWLNVTVMAMYEDEFIVGVLKKGKASWITEQVKGHFSTPDEAYDYGLKFIETKLIKNPMQTSLIFTEPFSHCGTISLT